MKVIQLIETGKRGLVTNQEMIPAIKKHLDNEEAIKALHEHFNEIFISSTKYLSKKEIKRIADMGITIPSHERKSIARFDEETESIKKGYIVSGKRTITNQQMLPAIKVNLNDKIALETLRNDYREVFESSMKYLSTKTQNYITTILDGKESVTIETKKKDVEPKEQVVEPKANVIQISDHFKSQNNEKLANAFKTNKHAVQTLSEEEVKLLELALQDKSPKEIGEMLNMTKDMVYNRLFRSKTSIINKLA